MHSHLSNSAGPPSPALITELHETAGAVGTVPPSPPTPRGAAGRFAIALLRPLLAWYTTQIRAFQRLSAEAHATEYERLRRLSELVNRHELALNAGNPDLLEVPDRQVPPAAAVSGEGANILDQIVTSYPSEQNALDIFRDEWLSMMPANRRDLRAGRIPLFDDPKVHWALAELGGVRNQRVLELGPLEAAHSYILQNAGAASVVAIESNTRAFLKCLIVKNLFHLDRVDFRCGNFLSYLEHNTERFDTIMASGVLYHMTNPVEMLELVSKATSRLFIWTHYYDEAIVSNHPGVCHRIREHWRASHAGFAHTLHRYEYKEALNVNFAGGLKSYSCWMEREEILACLRHFGFTDIRISFEERDHPHGPCFAFVALRT